MIWELQGGPELAGQHAAGLHRLHLTAKKIFKGGLSFSYFFFKDNDGLRDVGSYFFHRVLLVSVFYITLSI